MNSKPTNPIWAIATDLIKLYIAVGVIVRITLMFCLPEGASMSAFEIIRAIAVGAVNDLAMGILLCSPLLVVYLGHNEWKYRRLPGTTILGLLAILLAYSFYHNSIFHQYGGALPKIAHWLLGVKFVSFALRYFIPNIRRGWRIVTTYFIWGIYTFILIFNGASEYLFWDEFNVRYNFIAVDYLVYTHEVVGNIMESYAIGPMVAVTLALTVAFIWWRSRRRNFMWEHIYTPSLLFRQTAGSLAAAVAAWAFLAFASPHLENDNLSASQVQQNGPWDFLQAFRSSSLDYAQFYPMLPEDQCRDEYARLCGFESRQVTDSIATAYKEIIAVPNDSVNVVLITVESLSASFLTDYGGDKNITPCLDALIRKSLVFDSLYAVGNRTVRGLEALSLCLPPCAGESIVKRRDNRREGQTVGHILASRGYNVQYLYAGDSYFDNMGDFFGNNGYDVIDRKQIPYDAITFANIWGVCDEDLYRNAINVFDKNHHSGKPFFAQLMTVSNHRPYTFPSGKFLFDGDPQCRDGAVKYTDFAIGQFLRDAESHPWFNRTIFIIIADHCASSAGKTSIPIDKYHIPCIVYAPTMIQPCRVNRICSQIDVIPTLLAILGINVPTTHAGRNILADTHPQRAFMATYQDLGYLENNILTVLSPTRRVRQFNIARNPDGTHTESPAATITDSLARRANVYYQFSNLYQR